ncbi:MAG TPA: pyridoxal phosphate-dependent aminotransferase [Clostridiales bacterium]|nr:pyridoxal phosphate-dependent aminotransferase [Clostridiales bacterium]
MELSKKALEIKSSVTLEIDAKAKKMKAEGCDVVGFGAGEPDFNTPDIIVEAAKKALDNHYTRYTPVMGILELRQAICQKLQRDNGLTYNPNQILVSNGAKHSIYNALQAILNPEDEVIIPSPYWVSYPEMVKLGGGKPVFLETREENNFSIEIEQLKSLINKKTKALIINSPGNPTGCVYSKELLSEIAEVVVENNIFVISDEIYEKLVYDGETHVSIASLGDDIKALTIVINGMSKTYAMTGWRIGYAAAKEEVIAVMKNIQSHSTSNANSIAQYASIAALECAEQTINDAVDMFNTRRKILVEQINNIPGLSCIVPKGAFYIMVNIKDILGTKYKGSIIKDSLTFCDALLEDQMVAAVPGVAFGAEGYLRLSYATSIDNINKGIERIAAFIAKLE